ncbi:MAG: hypothetical protein ACI4LK_08980 [Lentihominibacter sp.]
MTEWGVFLVISALLGFMAAVIKPIIKLNTTMVRLIDSVNSLDESLESLTASNSNTHKRLWDELEDHDNKLNSHETRLQIIENEREVKR